MKTIIFLNKYSYNHDCYDFNNFKELSDYRKVAIIGEDYYEEIAGQLKNNFSKIYVVPADEKKISTNEFDYLNFSMVCQTIEKEIILAGSCENVYIVTADEINVELVGVLRDKYGLKGANNDTLLRYRNKSIMKSLLQASGVRVPKFDQFNSERYFYDTDNYFAEISMTFGLPFIVKPVSGAASFDTWKIESLVNFKNNLKGSIFDLEQYGYIIEEYIDGRMYCCDTVISDNVVVCSFVSEYLYPPLDVAQNDYTGCVIPLLFEDEKANKIRQFAYIALQKLGSVNGCSHMEIFEKSDGELIFLEAGARPPGGKSPFCYKTMYNYDLFREDLLAQLNLGEYCNTNIHYSGYACFWGIAPLKHGMVIKCNEPQINSEIVIDWFVKENEYIHKSASSIVEPAAVFTVFNKSYENLRSDFEYMRNFKFIDTQLIKPENDLLI